MAKRTRKEIDIENGVDFETNEESMRLELVYVAAQVDRRCTRCGKKHLSEMVYLELDTHTQLFDDPDVHTLPVGRSQGLFPFGKKCARIVLSQGRHQAFQRVPLSKSEA